MKVKPYVRAEDVYQDVFQQCTALVEDKYGEEQPLIHIYLMQFAKHLRGYTKRYILRGSQENKQNTVLAQVVLEAFLRCTELRATIPHSKYPIYVAQWRLKKAVITSDSFISGTPTAVLVRLEKHLLVTGRLDAHPDLFRLEQRRVVIDALGITEADLSRI